MEEKLAKVVFGKAVDGDRFWIKYFGIKIPLSIKPLSPNKLIAMSAYLSRIGDIKDEGQSQFHAVIENAFDLKYICKAIVIATGFPIKWIAYKAITNVSLEDVEKMFTIIQKNTDPSFFLNIMGSARRLNLMTKKE